MTAETAGVRVQQDTSCKDCGATVTPSDRFCPACGTPNAHTKFHPKFGPALRVVEPRIVRDTAPDGSPSCPRCQRLIAGDQDYCDGCGMELEVAWGRLHRNEALAQISGDGDLAPYRPTHRLALALQVLLAVAVVLAVAVAVGNCWLYARSGGRLLAGPATADLLGHLDRLTTALFVALGASYLVVVVWMRRSYRNLPALAVGGLRRSRRAVIPGWLVPGLNLVRPKQLLDELWRASEPTVAPMSTSWRSTPTSTWSAMWWAGTLVGLVLGVTTMFVEPVGPVTTVTGQGSVLALAAASAVLLAASTACLRTLVARIGERQDARAAFILGRGAELDAEERGENRPEPAAPATGDEPPVLLVRPSSRDAVYGKY